MSTQVDHTTNISGAGSPFHEITLITGSARRRRWSEEEKARIVAESLDRTVSVSAVAHRYGINPNQLFAWRKEFRSAALRRLAPEAEPAARAASSAHPASDATEVIEVTLGGMTLRVRSGVDPAGLRRVLGVVRELS